MNNFKKLFEEDVSKISPNQYERIEEAVWGNLGLFRLMGEVADIFMSRMVGVVIMAAGAEKPVDITMPKSHMPPPDQLERQPPEPGKHTPGNPDTPKI